MGTTEQGQVLLIIILVMVVSLTVGLSVVTRSITNLRVSTEEENSQRAFYAAEAGVEIALKSSGTTPVISSSGKGLPDTFSRIENVTINYATAQQQLLDKLALKDEVTSLWLVDYTQLSANPPPSWGPGTLTIYWGRGSDFADTCSSTEAADTVAALEIIVISSVSNPTATHYTYDPCNARRGSNKFSAPSLVGSPYTVPNIPGMTFRYRALIPPSGTINQGVLVRVVPLYTNTPLAVSASVALPSQGRRIESVGSSGGTRHKIVVMQGNPKFPTEFFPYLILSPL